MINVHLKNKKYMHLPKKSLLFFPSLLEYSFTAIHVSFNTDLFMVKGAFQINQNKSSDIYWKPSPNKSWGHESNSTMCCEGLAQNRYVFTSNLPWYIGGREGGTARVTPAPSQHYEPYLQHFNTPEWNMRRGKSHRDGLGQSHGGTVQKCG